MKHPRTIISALALALSFSHTPPVRLYAEETDEEEPAERSAEIQETAEIESEKTVQIIHVSDTEEDAEEIRIVMEKDEEAPAQSGNIIVRSIFLESEKDFDIRHAEENAVLISEKTIEAEPGSEFTPDYNLRAPGNDEFALVHDGAVLNEDYYRLSHIFLRKAEEEEAGISLMMLIYTFEQPWYLVTIHYEDIDTGEELFEPEVQKYPGSTNLKGPVTYDVKEFIRIKFDGYRFRGVSGDTLIGDVSSDKDIHILYEKEN